MITDEFLNMLRCPESRERLRRADDCVVADLNRAIAAGRLCNRSGQRLTGAISGLLVRDDGRIGYPVIDGMPILLIDEAIDLTNSTALERDQQ